MQRLYTVMILILVLLITSIGCLSFGRVEERTAPTGSQVKRCRAEMYLNDSVEVKPLGFKLEDSGLDDAIWFKTNVDDLSLVFDTTIVDTNKFNENITLMYDMKDLDWWDSPR